MPLVLTTLLLLFGFGIPDLQDSRGRNGAEREAWSIEKLALARGNGVSSASVKLFVVDIRKRSGRTFERETIVQRIPRMAWMVTDPGSRFTGIDIRRYAGTRQTLEAPGRSTGAPQFTNSFPSDYVYVENEIPWIGIPLSCAGRAVMGERYRKQGAVEVIVTTSCSNIEYIFLLNEATGLPVSMESWSSKQDDQAMGVRKRRSTGRIFYLAWKDGVWRMPSRVRIETPWAPAWGGWLKSEYEIDSWINPELDDSFFNLPMSQQMTAETWKAYLRSQ